MCVIIQFSLSTWPVTRACSKAACGRPSTRLHCACTRDRPGGEGLAARLVIIMSVCMYISSESVWGVTVCVLWDVVYVSEARGRCCPAVLNKHLRSRWLDNIYLEPHSHGQHSRAARQRDPHRTARQSSAYAMTPYTIYSYIISPGIGIN